MAVPGGSPRAPVARSFACAHCGGAVPVVAAPTVRCPFCQRVQALPPELVAELEAYRASSAFFASRLAVEQQEKSKWERWYRPDGSPRYGWEYSVALFAAVVLVMGLGIAAMAAGILTEATFGVVPFAVLGVYFFGMFGIGALAVRRRPGPASARPAVAAQCPHCGGPLPFRLGDVGRICPHCNGSLAVAAPIMTEALEAGALALRHAAIERHRLERKATSGVYRMSAGNLVPYIVVGSWLPMTGGGALVATISFLTDPRDTPLLAVAMTWTLALINAGILFIVYQFRATRRLRYRLMADVAAGSIAGRVITRTSDWVTWLNAFWAGPYAIARLGVGPYYHAVTGAAAGFPVALAIDAVPLDSQHYEPHAEVLVAASLADYPGHAPIPADLQHLAHEHGFVLEWNPGGFCASHQRPKDLRRGDPVAIGRSFVAVTSLLIECARRNSALPAPAMP